MSKQQSEAWKQLERDAARVLGGRRIVREDLFERAPDVMVDDMSLVCECKHRQRHSFHRWAEKVRTRYLRRGEVECVVTRERGGKPYCTVPLAFMGSLLDEVRAARRRASA